MKNWKRCLFILLLIPLLLLPLAGCQAEKEPDPTVTPTGDVSADTPTVPAGETLSLLNEDGTARYVVIRSDYEASGSVVSAAAVNVRRALSDATGVSFPIETDWVKRGTDMTPYSDIYEILVGDTNRPETETVKATLTDYSYKIEVVGKKIVLVGVNDRATALAVNEFIAKYCTAEGLKLLTDTTSILGTFDPEPSDIVLEDTSTGKTTPRLVETKYATEDVVIAQVIVTDDGYAVDPTGKGDSTAGIQKALNDCASQGGGTVYMPAGVYTVTGSITIPPFVTLRGDWQDPDVGTEYGTIIQVWMREWTPKDADNPFNEGTFLLGGSGGVLGLTVYYPFQSVENVIAYPPTFYTNGEGNNYMASMVKNCTVINGYLGIGACCKPSGAHEQLTVENFKGTFLYSATEVYNQADVGTWQNVVVNNKYWTEAGASCMTKADADALKAYTLAHTVGLKLGDLEWTEFENLQISDCLIGIQIVEGKRIQFAGSLYDVTIQNCKTGLQVDALDDRWGMVIARSTIEGGIVNKTGGAVKLCGVTVTGKTSGTVITTDGDLNELEIDYLRSYTKPVAKLYWAESLDKTGKTDVSAGLQALLDEAGKTGGVVYLSGGVYRFDNPISVPAGVELRGTAGGVNRCQGGDSNGTLFYCYYGDTDGDYGGESEAFITLAGKNAGLNGVRIIYPENGCYVEDITSSYAVRGKAEGVYIVNCSIAGAAYGVDFRGCDNHFVKKVTTCCYYVTFALGGENGMMSGCLQNGTVLARTGAKNLVNWLSEANVFNDLFDPILRQWNRYIVLEGAENEQIFNSFCYGCAVLVVCEDSEGLAVNLGSDNIGNTQTVMEDGDLTTVNTMRYNGQSYSHTGGMLTMYNRLTIGDKNEETYSKAY